jgi:hypothetical protein
VEGILEPEIRYTAGLRQRTPQAEIILVHGPFDSGEIVDQKDAFVDGFLDFVTDNKDAAGPGTLIYVISTLDIPDWIPTWVPEREQYAYYATRVVLEGSSLDAN